MSYRDAATSGTNIAASYGRAAECKERAECNSPRD